MKNEKRQPVQTVVTMMDGKPKEEPIQIVALKKRAAKTTVVEVFGTDLFTILYRSKDREKENTMSAMEVGYGSIVKSEISTKAGSSVSVCFVPDVRIGKDKDGNPILENIDIEPMHADAAAPQEKSKSKKGDK